jgi:hypothetical protein
MKKEAIKLDSGKPRLGLFPTEAIMAGGRALTYGVDKYADYNYKQGKGLDWNRYYDALLRHTFAWIGGEEYDKESGLRHTDHMMACCAMLADAVESGIGKDTRFKSLEDKIAELPTGPVTLEAHPRFTDPDKEWVIRDHHIPATLETKREPTWEELTTPTGQCKRCGAETYNHMACCCEGDKE